MTRGDVSLACAWALIDRLVGGGVEHACLSPGSRSTPLALALARHPDVEVHVHLDERSSAYFALGIAKASHRPVVVACTSGTAAAELFPAVVEASQSRVPLMLLTADRPPRLRGTGANQTIDQVELFGGYARAYLEPPVPSEPEEAQAWREAGERALDAMLPIAGPVHVNCAFEEPLAPSVDLASLSQTSFAEKRRSGPGAEPTAQELGRFSRLVSGARGVVLLGGWPTLDPQQARFWSEKLRWPVIAEPQSGCRLPNRSLAAGQALLGSGWLDENTPDVVVQFGAAPTTRASQALASSCDDLIVVDRFHLDPDPEQRASLRLHLDADGIVPQDVQPAPERWMGAWQHADVSARATLDAFLDAVDEPFEPRIARDLAAWVPAGGTLFVGNSSPIRDLDLAMAPREGLQVLANRGASGIDGLTSTALGIAQASTPTFALMGDLSFIHDVGAVMWNRGIDLTLVVLNNGGGELFAQLPQRTLNEHERLFLTPHGVDIGAVCSAAGVRHQRVERSSELVPALERAQSTAGVAVVEVMIGVPAQRVRRVELASAIAAALA